MSEQDPQQGTDQPEGQPQEWQPKWAPQYEPTQPIDQPDQPAADAAPTNPYVQQEPTQPYPQPGAAYTGWTQPYSQQPPQPGYPQPGAPTYGAMPYGQPTYRVPDEPRAQAAMIVGIISLALGLTCGVGLLGSPVALFMGLSSKRAIDQSNGALGGRGSAQAGFVLGVIGTALLVLCILAVIGLIALVASSSDTYTSYDSNV